MEYLMRQIEEWAKTYEFSFQFWGPWNNQVWVEKGGVELHMTGGHETPEEAIKNALEYVQKVNPTTPKQGE